MTETDTRQRILDSAEVLFGEHGISGTSLRAITRHSAVNLAAVNYHFGSKAELARAVVARRIEPLNRERLDELAAALEQRTGDLSAIVRAFAGPAIRMAVDHPEGHRFARMVARALVDPHRDIRAVVYEAFREVGPAFFDALTQTLPGQTADEIAWRMHFMIGALAHTVSCCVSEDETPVPLVVPDAATITDRLTAFLVAGLMAEAS